MRNPLLKRIPRELTKNSLKYLGMILILVCTICAGTSFKATLNSALDFLNEIKDSNLQEDGFFETTEPISDDTIDHFSDEGTKIYSNYYVTENEYNGDSKILIFDERNSIDIPILFEGRMPKADNEIVLDHCFSLNNEINVGDTISLCGRDFNIVGTVSLPDYTSLFMNNTDLVMNTTHFGVAVVSNEGFDEFSDSSVTYRYSYRLDDRELKDSDKLTKAEDIQKYLYASGTTVSTLLTSKQNQSISFLEMDIATDGPFIVVFVYILVVLIAFIFAILTNNTIEKESVIIGTLRASGYKKSEIIIHYLQPTLIVALLGSVIGNAIGYTAMIAPFLDMYYINYSIGPLDVKFDISMFLLTTVLPVVIMVIINYWMMARKLSLSPLKFLRGELKKGKVRKSVKLPNFSFLNRFRLRVIIQNRGSYVMLFLGVFLASFLLMFGLGLNPLMDHYVETIDESLPYEYQYFVKTPIDIDEVGTEQVFVYEMDTYFDLARKDVGITCYGITPDSPFFEITELDDVASDSSCDASVYLSSAAAKKLGYETGDSIELTDTNKDKVYTLSIKGIYEYASSLSIFIDRDELCKLLDRPDGSYNCILSDHKLDIDNSLIAKQVSRSDVTGAIGQMMDSFDTVMLTINVFSVVVYIVIIYILTRVVIDKNALSISYMKVFGYNAGEIRKLYLTSTTIVVIASLIVCIPIEIALFKATLVVLSMLIEGYMAFYLPTWVYIAIIAIGVAAYFFINGLNIISVKKISMTEALKNRE